MDYQEYLRRVPKVELHCHFEGTVRAPTFADLARRHGVELPTQEVTDTAHFGEDLGVDSLTALEIAVNLE